jgi:hypothetical protein
MTINSQTRFTLHKHNDSATVSITLTQSDTKQGCLNKSGPSNSAVQARAVINVGNKRLSLSNICFNDFTMWGEELR